MSSLCSQPKYKVWFSPSQFQTNLRPVARQPELSSALESYDLFLSKINGSPAFTVPLGSTKTFSILHPVCCFSALTVISIFIASRIIATFPGSSTSPSLVRTFQTFALRGEEILEIDGSKKHKISRLQRQNPESIKGLFSTHRSVALQLCSPAFLF